MCLLLSNKKTFFTDHHHYHHNRHHRHHHGHHNHYNHHGYHDHHDHSSALIKGGEDEDEHMGPNKCIHSSHHHYYDRRRRGIPDCDNVQHKDVCVLPYRDNLQLFGVREIILLDRKYSKLLFTVN